MSRAYAPPELVKYALVDGVGGQCTPQNSAAECSCDCANNVDCAAVRSGAFGTCLAGGRFGTCTDCQGNECIA
jgi:hypothetical protein